MQITLRAIFAIFAKIPSAKCGSKRLFANIANIAHSPKTCFPPASQAVNPAYPEGPLLLSY
jgi:hypothetical protein